LNPTLKVGEKLSVAVGHERFHDTSVDLPLLFTFRPRNARVYRSAPAEISPRRESRSNAVVSKAAGAAKVINSESVCPVLAALRFWVRYHPEHAAVRSHARFCRGELARASVLGISGSACCTHLEQGLSPLPFWITAVAAPCRTSNALRSSNGSGAIREKEIPRIVVPNWLE
jgi:hypothetical protein